MSNEKSILQSLLESTINHYSREAIIGALDFLATLSEDDLQEWSSGMSAEQAARVYRVARAARLEPELGFTFLLMEYLSLSWAE